MGLAALGFGADAQAPATCLTCFDTTITPGAQIVIPADPLAGLSDRHLVGQLWWQIGWFLPLPLPFLFES